MPPAVSLFRKSARAVLEGLLQRRARPLSDEELRAPAIVFAPHQDDETLGCGGTLAAKIKAGAEVYLVFLTDGAQSSGGLFDGRRLQEVRVDEALAAARILGVPEGRTAFWAFPDGRLRDGQAAAEERVAALLAEFPARQIFVPFRKDVHGDHTAANRIVTAALARAGFSGEVLEYPVWFWSHWPWIPTEGGKRGRTALKKSIRYSWPELRRFNAAVRLGGVLELKRRAYACYASQDELNAIAGGEFIRRFFTGTEYFCRVRMDAGRAEAR